MQISAPTRTYEEQTANLSLIGFRLVYEHVSMAPAQTPHSAATHVGVQIDVVLEQTLKAAGRTSKQLYANPDRTLVPVRPEVDEQSACRLMG